MSKMKRFRDIATGIIIGGVLFSSVTYAASSKIDVNFLPLKYFFDGVEKAAPPEQQGFVYKGSVYVPMRFVSEALGKNVGYDGSTTSVYVGKQKEGTVTYLEHMRTLTSDTQNVNKGSYVTNTGDTYTRSLYVSTWAGKAINEYALDGGYSKFEALIAPSEGFSKQAKQENIGFVRIYGDGKVLYDSGAVPSDITKPLSVSVDTKGILKLKVEMMSPGTIGGGVYIGLLDAKLIN